MTKLMVEITTEQENRLREEASREGLSLADLAVRRLVGETQSHTERNQAAIALIDSWLADESGYDEAVWPILEHALKNNPISLSDGSSVHYNDIE